MCTLLTHSCSEARTGQNGCLVAPMANMLELEHAVQYVVAVFISRSPFDILGSP
jgi:hypothetical protein